MDELTDNGIITGGMAGFAPQAAQDLSLVLRSGALPAIDQISRRGSGRPSLGADSIRAGLIAAIVALVGGRDFHVVLLQVFSGVNATIAMNPQSHDPVWRHGLFRCRADVAWYRGRHSDHRRGYRSNVLIFRNVFVRNFGPGRRPFSAVITSFNRVFNHAGRHASRGSDFGDVPVPFWYGGGKRVRGHARQLVWFRTCLRPFFVSRTLFEMGTFAQRTR